MSNSNFNVLVEEVNLICDDLTVPAEILSKSYLQNKLGVKFIRNSSHHCRGIPDYKYFFGGKCFYVEFKSGSDGLRKDQIRWIINNPDANVTIFYVNVVKSVDANVFSEQFVNHKIPLVRYDEELSKVLNVSRNAFMSELMLLFDGSYRIDRHDLIVSLSKKFNVSYCDMMIDTLVSEGFLFYINGSVLERL